VSFKEIRRKQSWPIAIYYPGIHLQELENLKQDCQYPSHNTKSGTSQIQNITFTLSTNLLRKLNRLTD
jgi:hypothetical protein